MITNWEQFEDWRAKSLQYHADKRDVTTYRNAMTYFEKIRTYFGREGFPNPEPRTKPTKNFPNGKIRKYTPAETREQKDTIRNWIVTNL